jgi:hypothetical protein
MSVRRRRFLHALAAAPLLPALGDAAPATPATAASPTPRPHDETARALGRIVEARYGSHLAPGDLDTIVKGIGDALEGAGRLRAYPLSNGDEPVTSFHARPGRAGAAGGR